MIIRKATLLDTEQLAVLFDSYRVFYNQSPDRPGAKSFLSERMRREQSVIFVAEEDGRLCGFTQLYPVFSSVGLTTAWLLNDLYVEEGSRNRGLGTALLNAARDFGMQNGSKWLLLQTGRENFAAQSVYEKNGWVKENDFYYRLDLN